MKYVCSLILTYSHACQNTILSIDLKCTLNIVLQEEPKYELCKFFRYSSIVMQIKIYSIIYLSFNVLLI